MLTTDQFAVKMLEGPTPFRPLGRGYDGADCWGLVYLAYRDVLGIELPTYDGRYGSTKPTVELAELLMRERDGAGWQEVLAPEQLDVVLLRVGQHAVPTHCGLVICAGVMLHVLAGTEACLEPYTGPVWRHRLAGFWQHPAKVSVEAPRSATYA